jgi:hypothetical protein
MKKSYLKKLISECINEVMSEMSSTPNEWEDWAKTTLKDKVQYQERYNGVISIEYYKYNFATVQLVVDESSGRITIEKYYDSEFLDDEYRYYKEYTYDKKEIAKKDFISQVSSIKGDILSDQG